MVSGTIAIYSGAIYRSQNSIAYIVGVVILSIPIFLILSDSFRAPANGDWIGAIVLLGFAALLWYWSSRMKSGKTPMNTRKRISSRRKRESRHR